jgi:AcrR family transcriptional regulator
VIASRGFEGATTQEIARVAGVAETSLFRHFGTKANLLSEAVIEPLSGLVAEFRTTWSRQLDDPMDHPSLMRAFVEQLYDGLRSRQPLVSALLAASLDPEAGDVRTLIADHLDPLFDDLVAMAEHQAERAGPTEVTTLTARVVVGMILSTVVLDSTLLPRGRRRPKREDVIRELTHVALCGIQPWPGTSPKRKQRANLRRRLDSD